MAAGPSTKARRYVLSRHSWMRLKTGRMATLSWTSAVCLTVVAQGGLGKRRLIHVYSLPPTGPHIWCSMPEYMSFAARGSWTSCKDPVCCLRTWPLSRYRRRRQRSRAGIACQQQETCNGILCKALLGTHFLRMLVGPQVDGALNAYCIMPFGTSAFSQKGRSRL